MALKIFKKENVIDKVESNHNRMIRSVGFETKP